jgi:AraC-like DNA-binding protein
MAYTIPLIRAGCLLPVVRWMEADNWPVERCLAAADLGYWLDLAPDDPIPTLNAIQLLRDAARRGGPDLGYRIVTQASVGELAFIGRVALGAATPREALLRVSAAMPFHSSHEDIHVSDFRGGIKVREIWRLKIDSESLHLVQVYVAALIHQICAFTGLGLPLLQRIEMQAHPKFGVAHLDGCFGIPVVPATDRILAITLTDNVANAAFRVVAKDRLPGLMAAPIPPLAEDATLAGSVRSVIAAMLHGGEPTVKRVARAGTMSVRTLQRRLAEEGSNLSDQLGTVRRKLAARLLLDRDASMADITERLGYSSPSALSRAVRRWTGTTPSWIKSQRGM